MAKVLCVLYDDPITGHPKSYARDGLPIIERYPDGQTLPTPKGIDIVPGTMLGSVSVRSGKLAGAGAHSYSVGNTTGGSEKF